MTSFARIAAPAVGSVLLTAVALAPGQAYACGMHAFGFSPFAHMRSNGPEAAPKARLSVSGMLVPRPDTPSKVTLMISTPPEFESPLITIDSPEAIAFDGGLEVPLAEGQKNLSLPYTATTGNHWVTFTLTGTLEGEDVKVSRRVYFAVRAAAVASR
ncbi:MAG: hypothetical protein AAGI24_04670 [Pseudomonadota bacterium]